MSFSYAFKLIMVEEVIQHLRKEEVRYYKLFTQRTERSNDRKDLALFDAYRSGRSFKHENENALYRLKNRVFHDLNLSLYMQHLENDPSYIAFQYLFLAQTFRRRQCYSIAYKYLKKGPKHTLKKDDAAVLNSLYSEFISLSHDLPEIDLHFYIEERKKSEVQLKQIQDIDNVLAVLTHRINTTQSFSQSNFELQAELRKLIERYSDAETLNQSKQLRLKVYKGVSHLLLREKHYRELEAYLKETYDDFERNSIFDQSSHQTKLEMIIYRINSLFKLNQYKESLQQSELLLEQLKLYQAKFRNAYIFFYFNAQIINFSILDPNKALGLIDEALLEPAISQNPQHWNYLHIDKTQLLHQLGEIKSALRTIARLTQSAALKNMPENYRMKVALAQIMLRYEQLDFDQLERELHAWENRYKLILDQDEHQRERLLAQIIREIIFDLNEEKQGLVSSWKEELISFANEEEAEDMDVLNYVRWVKKNVAHPYG